MKTDAFRKVALARLVIGAVIDNPHDADDADNAMVLGSVITILQEAQAALKPVTFPKKKEEKPGTLPAAGAGGSAEAEVCQQGECGCCRGDACGEDGEAGSPREENLITSAKLADECGVLNEQVREWCQQQHGAGLMLDSVLKFGRGWRLTPEGAKQFKLAIGWAHV